jgi:hypothetical protein
VAVCVAKPPPKAPNAVLAPFTMTISLIYQPLSKKSNLVKTPLANRKNDLIIKHLSRGYSNDMLAG